LSVARPLLVERRLRNQSARVGDLVNQVFEKSTGEINNVIDEFERLRES
jgi:hypothetical protein